MSILVILMALTASAGSGGTMIQPVAAPATDDVLQYDDGTAWWVTWGGLYRGTWFHTADFYSESCEFMLGGAEFWFYQQPGYPWDTDQFIAEVYNGAQSGPEELLYDTTVTAAHMTGVIIFPADSILTGPDFWLVENTELSGGGWPSISADGTPNASSHSFFSEDGEEWEPWIVGGETACDYLIRAHGSPVDLSLQSETWGGIKTLF
jgi:hypothetical protein